MIKNSFVFLERIGSTTERSIWSQGIRDWDSFISAKTLKGFSTIRHNYYSNRLKDAKHHLMDHDSSFFHSTMPKGEIWRLYNHFKDDALFLDIETTGYYADISVLGAFDGEQSITLVRNKNLDSHSVRKLFEGRKLLVTFNGLSFDIPVINRCFGKIVPDIPHLDLRFPLAKLGYTGGLKSIEKSLGIRRPEELNGVSGEDAVRLWYEYTREGNISSLNTLLSYNEQDAINLKPLADIVFRELRNDIKKKYSL